MNKTIVLECVYNIIDTNKVQILQQENSVLFSGDILTVSSVKILAENIGLNTSGYMSYDEKGNSTSVQINF